MSYVVRSYDNACNEGGTWHGPYERLWIAQAVVHRLRKEGRPAEVVEVEGDQ